MAYEGQIVDHLEAVAESLTSLDNGERASVVQALERIEYHLRVLAACATGYLFHIHDIELKTPDDVSRKTPDPL